MKKNYNLTLREAMLAGICGADIENDLGMQFRFCNAAHRFRSIRTTNLVEIHRHRHRKFRVLKPVPVKWGVVL